MDKSKVIIIETELQNTKNRVKISLSLLRERLERVQMFGQNLQTHPNPSPRIAGSLT
jgi:hypothetical protein